MNLAVKITLNASFNLYSATLILKVYPVRLNTIATKLHFYYITICQLAFFGVIFGKIEKTKDINKCSSGNIVY